MEEEYKRCELFKIGKLGKEFKRKRKMCVSFVNLLSGHLPGYSPADMVGYGGVSVVPPCWANLGKEHPVFWFVALDCRDEPEQAEFESPYLNFKCVNILADEHYCDHIIIHRVDQRQKLSQIKSSLISLLSPGLVRSWM